MKTETINKYSWYFNRLRKMPVLEIPYRIDQAIKKNIDRKNGKRISIDIKTSTRINIKQTDVSDFYRIFPGARNAVLSDAENILKHEFNIFGIEKDFGNPINWHLDPKTNNSWPLKFWGDINYRDGKTIGGIKFAWELNRLHHLPHLSIAFSITKDSRYKDEIFCQLQSWLEANPYPKGINWISGIELGIRVVNIAYTLKFLGNEPLTSEQQRLILQFISIHGRHLYHYPSKYTSCGNHAIAEALGMFTAGLCFPDIDGADKWKSFGKKV